MYKESVGDIEDPGEVYRGSVGDIEDPGEVQVYRGSVRSTSIEDT